MVSLVVCLGIGLVFTLLTGFVAFDQLVRLQCTTHRQAWIEDGQPTGFLWNPPGRRIWHRLFYRMNHNGSLCFYSWVFNTPQWVKQDKVARRHLRRMRICFLVWIIGFLWMWLWGLGHPELFRWLNKRAV